MSTLKNEVINDWDYMKKNIQSSYVFKQDYNAIDKTATGTITINGATRTLPTTRLFKKGDVAIGSTYINTQLPAGMKAVPSVLIEGKYIIPQSMLTQTAAVIKVPDTGDIIAKAKGIERNKAFRKGALFGTVAGVVYGFAKNKSVFISAIVGMAGGGVLGYMFLQKKYPTTAQDTASGSTNTNATADTSNVKQVADKGNLNTYINTPIK